MSLVIFITLQFAIIAFALVSGVFLAFSGFIICSLAHTGGIGGVDAMQAINRWVFMTLFIGMAPVSLAIAAYGGFVAGNGPRALAGMDASSDAARDYWTGTYLPRWTFWNSVRTVASAASAALLLFGLLRLM